MFRFEVKFWNEEAGKTAIEKGLVCGIDYGAAANRLVKYYGEEYVINISLNQVDDILLDEDLVNECKE